MAWRRHATSWRRARACSARGACTCRRARPRSGSGATAWPASRERCCWSRAATLAAMRVLGIESSCDETGVALYDSASGAMVHALHSQVELHREYGGVVPELASRDHVRRLLPLIGEVLQRAGCERQQIDAVAVTAGPGLAGALLVGCG